MTKYSTGEKGFGAVEVVLVIVAVAAIGAAVYLGFRAHNLSVRGKAAASSPAPSPVASATTTPTTSAAPGFVFDISELGVKFTAPAAFTGLTYQQVHLTGDQAVNSVELSTKTLTTATCPISSAPLGYLTYDSDKGGQKVATARNSDLYYIAPTGTCAASNYAALKTALQGLVTDLNN